MDVGDQAGCFWKARGGEKFGCRRENVDRMAQRSHEPAHGLTKEPIIIDDRDQHFFHHAPMSIRRIRRAPTVSTLRMKLLDMSENATSAVPMPLNFGLPRRPLRSL